MKFNTASLIMLFPGAVSAGLRSSSMKPSADTDHSLSQLSAGLRSSVRDELQTRTSGGDLRFQFQDASNLSITKGGGGTCMQMGNDFVLTSGGDCTFDIKFNNGASCTGVNVNMEGGMLSYYKVGHNGDTNCLKIISSTGGDMMGGSQWPCQNDGCFSAPTGTLVFASTGAGTPAAAAAKVPVKATWSWDPAIADAGVYKIEATKGSSSKDSSGSSTTFSVSASAGPALSASAGHDFNQAAEQALSRSDSNSQEIKVEKCSPESGRWRQVWTYTSIATGEVVNTINSEFTICTEHNKIPLCPIAKCRIPNCQECN